MRGAPSLPLRGRDQDGAGTEESTAQVMSRRSLAMDTEEAAQPV
jgi:hypothetical protein